MPSYFGTLTLGGIIWYLITLTHAATVEYNFNVSWVTANPDGAFERRVMGINGQWPIPHIVADIGDHVIVHVTNQLGDQGTGLHFHGLYQNGTPEMDGPVGATQCPIAPGMTFKYEFDIQQPGTYWYHSHSPGQYPDGLRGALIVNDPKNPFKDQYDEEIVLTLSDWYHDEMPDLIRGFINIANPTGAEPVPNSALMNDTQNLTVPVEPGKTYMVRIINMAAFAAQYIWFEEHTVQIIEVDGIYTDPADADVIYITAAQRYSVLLKTKDDKSANFAIVGSMDQDLFDAVPDTLNPNVTGWLVYDDTKENPEPAFLDEFDEFDDFTLVPQDHAPILDKVDHTISIDMEMNNLNDGANYAFFNGITYVQPKVPTLYTALTTGDTAKNPMIYGTNVNAIVLEKDEVVEIVLNSLDPGKHPFHLHGHSFQAVVRGEEEAGTYNGSDTKPDMPMRRDTFMVKPDSYIVLRFRADNPDNGLSLSLIEAPDVLQSTLKIPDDHLAACKAQGIATAGNAAGRTDDLLNLDGAYVSPGPIPDGFTKKGIVALVFSILTAFLGMAVISWYGVGEIGKKVPTSTTVEK